jgi:hypothetical protein
MYRLISGIFTTMAIAATAAVVLLSGCADNPSGPSTVATGTPDKVWYYRNITASTFTIYNADELAGLAQLVNDDGILFEGKTVKLGGNIGLARLYGETYNDGKGWIPIGTGDNPFRGVFDGNGKMIGGLYINTFNTYYSRAGLFGYIWDGTVKNLGVEDVNITGGIEVGGVVGEHIYDGIIENCYVTGKIHSNGGVAGGIAGSSGKIINCHTSAAVSASRRGISAGGVAGTGNVINCYSTGNVRIEEVSQEGVAGGVVGRGSATNCYSTGTVTVGSISIANSVVVVGGVVGSGGAINCYAAGAVSGSGYSGGVSGNAYYEPQVINSVALNPGVSGGASTVGRVVGPLRFDFASPTEMSNNAAFSGITNGTGSTSWYNKGADALDGADITAADIMADGTLGGRFTAADGWTTQNGRLPGLFGETVAIPVHIR